MWGSSKGLGLQKHSYEYDVQRQASGQQEKALRIRLMDTDGDGKASGAERRAFKQAMRDAGYGDRNTFADQLRFGIESGRITQEEVDDFLRADKNRDGKVSEAEGTQALLELMDSASTKDTVARLSEDQRAALEELAADTNRDGTVTDEERKALQDELAAALELIDRDGNGELSSEEKAAYFIAKRKVTTAEVDELLAGETQQGGTTEGTTEGTTGGTTDTGVDQISVV
jgi:Ca2+-binding EF-hand superfamily protein